MITQDEILDKINGKTKPVEQWAELISLLTILTIWKFT